MPHPRKFLLCPINALINLLPGHLQYHPSFLPTPLNHPDPDKCATPTAATHRYSTNEILLYTAYSTVPIIFPPEYNPSPSPKYTDRTSTSPTTYPPHIIIPLSAPSTPPSEFSPRLPLDFPFDTPPGAHTSIPSDSSPLTL